MHLADATGYFLREVKSCMTSDDNHTATAAKKMFYNNRFPDMKLQGLPSNDITPQPHNEQEILQCFQAIEDQLNEIEKMIGVHAGTGKTKHSGLEYFNVSEWLQFAEMHFRHHIRQEKRLDDCLALKNVL